MYRNPEEETKTLLGGVNALIIYTIPNKTYGIAILYELLTNSVELTTAREATNCATIW
jgi:hypothetical protein